MKTLSALTLVAALASACAPMPTEPAPAPPSGDAEQCRASAYQSYVGRNRSTLPQQPAGETWRVTCTTCPVTMDYNPRRLNILYNERTNIIEQVRCG